MSFIFDFIVTWLQRAFIETMFEQSLHSILRLCNLMSYSNINPDRWLIRWSVLRRVLQCFQLNEEIARRYIYIRGRIQRDKHVYERIFVKF